MIFTIIIMRDTDYSSNIVLEIIISVVVDVYVYTICIFVETGNA